MQIIFKRYDGVAEQTIDVSPDSRIGESREVAQMLLGLPENVPCSLIVERTKKTLEDSLTFKEAGIQNKDRLILSLPVQQEVKPPQDATQVLPPKVLPSTSSQPLSSNNSFSLNNWSMAIITGSVFGVFVLAAIFIGNFNNYLGQIQPVTSPSPLPSPTPVPAPTPIPTIASPTPIPMPTTPTPTFTPPSTSIPAPVLDTSRTNASISGDSSHRMKNIRSGPSTDYGVIESVEIGSRVRIISQTTGPGGYLWYEVYNPKSSKKGWIAGHLVKVD